MSQQAHNQACNSRSRELYNQRMTAETPEAREARLARRRVTYRARRDAETPERREARLAAARARRDAETPEAREARLARRRLTDIARRDACRERARAQSRRANETPAERDHRLAADRDRSQSRRDRARVEQDQLEASQSNSSSRMVGFYESISSLSFSTCETCLEQFPNMSVSRQPNGVHECRRCATDKHIPKLYSSGNNMNPGPVPPQLQV